MPSWVAIVPHILILAITTLKVWQIIRSDTWIWKHGTEYQKEYSRLSTSALRDVDVREALLDRMGGGIFPFGLKSYRLRRWLRGGRSLAAQAIRVPLRIFNVLFAFYVYPVVASIYVAGSSHLSGPAGSVDPSAYLAFTTGCLVLIGCLGIAVEAALSYTQMSAWGTIYHGFARGRSDNPARSQSEFAVALGAILMAYISAIGVTYLAGARLGAFTKIQDAGVVELLSASAFYALMGMLQAGDADPRNNFGRLVVALVAVNSAALFLIVIALVIGSASGPALGTRPISSRVNEPEGNGAHTMNGPPKRQVSAWWLAVALAIAAFIWRSARAFRRNR